MGLVLGKEDVEDDASQNRPESPTFSEPDEPAPPPPREKKAARPTMVGGQSLFNLFAQKEEPAAPPPAPKPAPPKADRPTMVGGSYRSTRPGVALTRRTPCARAPESSDRG